MPKRQTLLYTSHDGLKSGAGAGGGDDGGGAGAGQLVVYYCRFSGRHAFTADVDIDALPRRRTDNARILDTSKHLVRLYTTDGGVKLLRRADGAVERQHRLNIGPLPVAYRAGGDGDGDGGRLLYVMDGAVTAFMREPNAGDRVPVPPCIRRAATGAATEAVLELEDRQPHAAVGRITADAVLVHLTGSASGDAAQHELLQLLSRVLNLRLPQLMLARGAHAKQRVLTVEGLTPRQVYRALRGDAPRPGGAGGSGRGGRGRGDGGGGGGRHGGGRHGGGRGRKPWYSGL